MESTTKELSHLVELGRKQGYLTYDQVSNYLPDEANSAEKLDELLVALDRGGIEIVEAGDVPEAKTQASAPAQSASVKTGNLKIHRPEDEQARYAAAATTSSERGPMSSDPV